jgi:hypothetical protein
MSRFHLMATLAALSLGLAAPAMAQSYPRTVGTGENAEIDYGPSGPGNLVGGGRVVVTGTGEDAQFLHLDPQFAQAPRIGEIPVTVGSGEDSTTVWVPAGTSRNQLALIGPGGSLPAEIGTNGSFLAGRLGGRC